MNQQTKYLLSLASPSLANASEQSGELILKISSGSLTSELLNILAQRNGFYAFESALLVRPVTSDNSPLGIIQWNDPALWKSEYKINSNLTEVIFFAEDIFGMQFCIKNNTVVSFNPETGESKFIANTIDEWANWILENDKVRTGWPLAHLWQKKHGVLKSGMRLLPKVPFVLGGQFAIEDLYKLNDVESMRFRASVANQLLDCPDGSKVVLKMT